LKRWYCFQYFLRELSVGLLGLAALLVLVLVPALVRGSCFVIS
jgi:hypothetical protein